MEHVPAGAEHFPVQVSDETPTPDDVGFFATSDIKEKKLEEMKRSQQWEILLKQTSTETVSMSSCELINLPEEILDLTNLTRLYLTYNKLTELPEGITRLENLRMLNLGCNEFEHIPVHVYKLKHLQVLYMRNNNLTTDGIDESILLLSNLEELYLSNNNLSTFPNQVCHMQSLQLLTLSNNAIMELPSSIRHMTRLKVLTMRSNQLKKIPEEFGELQSLEKACFAQNMIESFPFDKIANMKVLTDLCVYANRLRERYHMEVCINQLAERGGIFRAEENRIILPRLGGVCDGPSRIWKSDILWLHDGDLAVKSWIEDMAKKLKCHKLNSRDFGPHEKKMQNYLKRSRVVAVVCTESMCNLLGSPRQDEAPAAVRTALEAYFRDVPGPPGRNRSLWLVVEDRVGISQFLVGNCCTNLISKDNGEFLTKLVNLINSWDPNPTTSPSRGGRL